MEQRLPLEAFANPEVNRLQENVRRNLETRDARETAPGGGSGASNKIIKDIPFSSAGPVFTVRVQHNLGRMPVGVVPIRVRATGVIPAPFAYYETERTTSYVEIYSAIDALVDWWVF